MVASSLLLLAALFADTTPSAGPSREQAIALIAPTLKINSDDVVVGQWSQHPGQWVAAVPRMTWEDDGVEVKSEIHVGILVEREHHWVVVARGQEHGGGMTQTAPAYTLDFAPFRINETETAFGVRESFGYSSTAHSESESTLRLFRQVGSQLVPIFKASVAASGTTREEESDKTLEGFNSKAVVAVAKHKTNGFFDLTVTTATTDERRRKRKAVETFVWQVLPIRRHLLASPRLTLTRRRLRTLRDCSGCSWQRAVGRCPVSQVAPCVAPRT